MPKSWLEVSQSDEFLALPADKQEEARNLYFDEVVAPKVNPEELPAVRQAFDADTKIADDGSFLGDAAASFGVGANQLLGLGGDLAQQITGSSEPNFAQKQSQIGIDYWQEKKSNELKAAEARRAAKISQADSVLGEFGAAVGETAKDPLLAVSTVSEQVPNLVGMGAVGRGIGLGAKALKAGETASGAIGTAGAVGAGGAMQGTDIAGDTYQRLMSLPDSVWEDDPDYVALAILKDPVTAKHEISLELSRASGLQSAGVSVATNMLPGARILEHALVGAGNKIKSGIVGKAAAGILGEGGQEALEEGGGQYIGNLSVKQVDPTVNPTENVGGNAGLGFAGGGVFGGAAGAVTPTMGDTKEDKKEDTNKIVQPPFSEETQNEPNAEAANRPQPAHQQSILENINPDAGLNTEGEPAPGAGLVRRLTRQAKREQDAREAAINPDAGLNTETEQPADSGVVRQFAQQTHRENALGPEPDNQTEVFDEDIDGLAKALDIYSPGEAETLLERAAIQGASNEEAANVLLSALREYEAKADAQPPEPEIPARETRVPATPAPAAPPRAKAQAGFGINPNAGLNTAENERAPEKKLVHSIVWQAKRRGKRRFDEKMAKNQEEAKRQEQPPQATEPAPQATEPAPAEIPSENFKPTNVLPDGTEVMPTEETDVRMDSEGAEIEDNAEPINEQQAQAEAEKENKVKTPGEKATEPFAPTHELEDGTLVKATKAKKVWIDENGKKIIDSRPAKKLRSKQYDAGKPSIWTDGNREWDTRVFKDTLRGGTAQESANAFLEKNPDYGVIGEHNGFVHVAKNADKGREAKQKGKVVEQKAEIKTEKPEAKKSRAGRNAPKQKPITSDDLVQYVIDRIQDRLRALNPDFDNVRVLLYPMLTGHYIDGLLQKHPAVQDRRVNPERYKEFVEAHSVFDSGDVRQKLIGEREITSNLDEETKADLIYGKDGKPQARETRPEKPQAPSKAKGSKTETPKPRKPLESIRIDTKAVVEETGEEVDINEKASVLLEEADARLDALQKLLDCLRT